ncbi:unnamed protein product, partial [Mesorhabditis spiculigera]
MLLFVSIFVEMAAAYIAPEKQDPAEACKLFSSAAQKWGNRPLIEAGKYLFAKACDKWLQEHPKFENIDKCLLTHFNKPAMREGCAPTNGSSLCSALAEMMKCTVLNIATFCHSEQERIYMAKRMQVTLLTQLNGRMPAECLKPVIALLNSVENVRTTPAPPTLAPTMQGPSKDYGD